MAASVGIPSLEDSHTISVVECDGEIDSIRVKVMFSGIKKEEIDASTKMLRIPGLKIPMSRFGSWVFRITGCNNDLTNMKLGEPTVSFVWALYKSYPEISAWVDDASNCSFILEFEKERKTWISNEIGSRKMQEKIQKYLSEIPDIKLTIKMIRIVTQKPVTAQQKPSTAPQEQASTSESHSPSPTQIRQKTKSSKSAQQGAGKETTTEETFRYLKLKTELKETQDRKERLKILTELANLSFKMGKFSEDSMVFEEMKTLMPEVQASQEDINAILQNIRKLCQLLHDEGKLTKSIDILLAASSLVRKIRKTDDRVDAIITDLGVICEIIAKIFGIRSNCLQVAVDAEDELGRPRTDQGSGTQFAQASKAQQHGKRAFKKYDFNEALRCYEAAIKLQPKEMLYRLDKAEVYLAEGKFDECRNECADALKPGEGPKNQARAYELLGEAELRSYNPLVAVNHFKKSVNVRSSHDVVEKFTRLNQALLGAFNAGQEQFVVNMMQLFGALQAGGVPNPSLPQIPPP